MNILNNTYKSSFISSLFSVIICFIILCICAALITYTNTSEALIPIFANGSLYFSAFLGGFLSAFRKNSGGLIRGLICGLCICLYMCIGAVIMPSFKISLMFLLKLLIIIISSAIGGIFSVNISYKKHR